MIDTVWSVLLGMLLARSFMGMWWLGQSRQIHREIQRYWQEAIKRVDEEAHEQHIKHADEVLKLLDESFFKTFMLFLDWDVVKIQRAFLKQLKANAPAPPLKLVK